MARKKKPASPEEIAQRKIAARGADLAAVSLQPEAARLVTYGDVEVTRAGSGRDTQVVDGNAARRLDAFAALRPSMQKDPFTGAYDAARQLERDITMSMGLHDSGPSERVDCDAPGRHRVDVMLAARDRVRAVSNHLPKRDWWLLNELIAPTRDYDGWRAKWVNARGEVERGHPFYGWRAIVAYVTGETHDHAHGSVVRSACVNLRDAYRAIEEKKAA